MSKSVGVRNNTKEGSRESSSAGKQKCKILLFLQGIQFHKTHLLHCQPFSSLCPPARNNPFTGRSFHPASESMGAFSLTC